MFTLDTLLDLYSAVSIFPSLRSLTVQIFSYWILERNAYYTLFRILSTLPFYNDIDDLAFIWFGTEAEWYNDIEKYRLLPETEKSTVKLYDWTMKQYPKARELLGPLIPEDQFPKKMGDLRLPKNLQAYRTNLGPAANDFDSHFLPVVNSASIQTLAIHKVAYPLKIAFDFPTVKNLTLNLDYKLIYRPEGFEVLKYRFPNLESLRIIKATWTQSVRYIFCFPNMPMITQLDIPWPGSTPHKYKIDALEHFLSPMLNERNQRNLERCTFRGTTCSIAGPVPVIATCTISKSKELDINISSNVWEFQWEGDIDFDQMEKDWKDWEALERQEDLDSDYVPSEGEEPGSSVSLNEADQGEYIDLGDGDSEFSGDSEYPETGDELYPVDTDEE
ncbi:hypothetical protein TWF506_002580 [Arthrobotrys conoides]|uniref:Uncharacterized protein n=1 Tax=Arthrobotrys conoides TaxID=74498 RepID=A0AAN8N4P6_9PEZI